MRPGLPVSGNLDRVHHVVVVRVRLACGLFFLAPRLLLCAECLLGGVSRLLLALQAFAFIEFPVRQSFLVRFERLKVFELWLAGG